MAERGGSDVSSTDAEMTPHDTAQRAILREWEDTPMETRMTWDELQLAANLAIKALRSEGWARV